jgi:hypothetical protein
MSGSSAGASGFDIWDHFLDRTGIEDGKGVVEMEAKPMSTEYFFLLVKSKQGSTQGER